MRFEHAGQRRPLPVCRSPPIYLFRREPGEIFYSRLFSDALSWRRSTPMRPSAEAGQFRGDVSCPLSQKVLPLKSLSSSVPSGPRGCSFWATGRPVQAELNDHRPGRFHYKYSVWETPVACRKSGKKIISWFTKMEELCWFLEYF